MHIRAKDTDGSFRDIFVNDDRDPNLSRQFSARRGLLAPRAGGTFLVLQTGDLVREDRASGESSVVRFDTYALDLSELGGGASTAIYESQERSTATLLNPPPNDPYHAEHTQRIEAELHARMSAPLYTLVFALVALAFLGRPRTNRQDRTLAIAAVALISIGLKAAGFATTAVARNVGAAVPFLYAIPIAGLIFGLYATLSDARLRMPTSIEIAADEAMRLGRRLFRRLMPGIEATSGEQR
jgi:lipopolysaccharide export system permease protein